jgi:hypothetical protein
MLRSLALVFVQARASVVGADLLVHRFVAWNFSTMFGCIAKGASLVAEVLMGLAMRVRMVAVRS